jgi:hypothetical protein
VLDTVTTTYTTTADPVFDQDGNLIEFRENTTTDSYSNSYRPYESGRIYFETIAPVSQAVPEPLTILGVGTACGIGTFFKRELKRQKKDQ